MNLFFSATTVLLMLLFKVVLSSVNSHTKIQKRRFNMQEFSSEGSEDASDKGDESDAIDDRYIDLISCKKETAASDMDLLQMMNRAKPATRQAKCLSACYLNKIGVMIEEKFIPENLSEFVSDETLIGSYGRTLNEVSKDLADECKTVSDADKCESAAKILICLNAAVRKRGFCRNVF